MLESLVDFVRQAMTDYSFPSPQGNEKDCQVFLHGLPEDQDAETHPFVIVRWLEGEIVSQEDARTVLRDTVILVLGVHSPKSQARAGILLAEMIDCLRRALWKKRLLAKRFELEEPLKVSIPDLKQRIHRFHLATVETTWNYVWPPQSLREAGQSQLAGIGGACSRV